MELTPPGEIQTRIERLQSHLRNEKVESCLIVQNVDLFYFSGTVQRSYLYIPSDGDPILMVQKDFDRARKESPLKNIIPIERPRAISSILKKEGGMKRVGLECDVLPVTQLRQLEKMFPHSEFVDISKAIKQVRMVKSPYEIGQLRRSAKILDEVFEYAKKVLKTGMTEIEAESHLIELGRLRGHQGLTRMRAWNQDMVNACVLSGKSGSALTHLDVSVIGPGISPAFPQGSSFNPIGRDVPIQIDFSIAYNGYITDGARTYVIGALPGELKEAYGAALEIRDEMERMAKPGVPCSQLYHLSSQIVKKKGLEDYFIGTKKNQAPFVGHGVGLEIDELPLLAMGFFQPLEIGMVFAFEPKFIFPEIGAVALEDDYVVTEEGVEKLTCADDHIIVIPES
ncbi:MAG TPA: Xaa-Pro peptidase family protein [Thermodesulfobacteriota bacterium]|nr:Xaa-Pro peptidase family protein [Thermodesulfobacteriota bacterium]